MQEIYNPHEYADLFPLITGDEFVELKSNIKERGLLNPVITLNGKILDVEIDLEPAKRLVLR